MGEQQTQSDSHPKCLDDKPTYDEKLVTTKTKSNVKLLLEQFQQYCILNKNEGFYLKDFENFFRIPNDKQRLLKIAETGANHGKFIVYWMKPERRTPNNMKSSMSSKIYLDRFWAKTHNLPSPPEYAYMHCGSKRVYSKKVKDDDNLPILNKLTCSEEDILVYWKKYYAKRGDSCVVVDHLKERFNKHTDT